MFKSPYAVSGPKHPPPLPARHRGSKFSSLKWDSATWRESSSLCVNQCLRPLLQNDLKLLSFNLPGINTSGGEGIGGICTPEEGIAEGWGHVCVCEDTDEDPQRLKTDVCILCLLWVYVWVFFVCACKCILFVCVFCVYMFVYLGCVFVCKFWVCACILCVHACVFFVRISLCVSFLCACLCVLFVCVSFVCVHA